MKYTLSPEALAMDLRWPGDDEEPPSYLTSHGEPEDCDPESARGRRFASLDSMFRGDA